MATKASLATAPGGNPLLPGEPKWWGHSVTIWGVVITTLTTVAPALGPLIGVEIPAEVVQQVGDHAIQIVQGIGGLIGIVMTVYGRARASAGLARREMRVKL